MKTRILSILLTLCMVLCLAPTAAFAADTPPYEIYIANEDGDAVQITSSNQNDVLGDGTVSFKYDEANEKGILTLNGANIDSDDEYPIDASDMENLEIVLVGENYLASEWVACINAGDNLTISGEGSIEISTDGSFNWPVTCNNNFTLNGGNVKISSIDYALLLDETLTVNGGTLELIASGEDGVAIDIGFEELKVNLGDDRIMITSENADGSDAKITDASDTGTITAAKYVKVFNKYSPVTYAPGAYGSEPAFVQNKEYGTSLTLSDAIFTRNGYKQIGWAITDGGDKAYAFGSLYENNEPLTLYPVWQLEQYSITYDLGSGTVTGNPDSYTVETDTFTLNNPTRVNGFDFAGWSGTDLTGTDNMTVTVPKGSTGNRTYTANWLDVLVPRIVGLTNGKAYCGAVEFSASDNDGIASVTVNGTTLQAENGKYTLQPAQGAQAVVAKDKTGNSVTVTVTVNNGHTGGAATCTEKAKCEVCDAEYGELNPNNHTGTKEWTTRSETEHEQKCSCCGKVTVAKEAHEWENGTCSECGYVCAHTGGKATCTEKSNCEICGESYGELNAKNHAALKHIDAKAATQAAQGNIEYWHCEDCGKYFADAAATKEIAKADTVTAKLPEEKPTSPKTGDTSNLALWIALGLVSAGAATAAVMGKKKMRAE